MERIEADYNVTEPEHNVKETERYVIEMERDVEDAESNVKMTEREVKVTEREAREVNPYSRAYRKKTDAVFEPLTITHDECVARVLDVMTKLSLENVTKAFLSSFSTRRLELRSALPSFCAAAMLLADKGKECLSVHSFQPHSDEYYKKYGFRPVTLPCKICEARGISSHKDYVNEDLNILNLERVMFGGVRHSCLEYIMFDLEEFSKLAVPEPCEEDIEIFKKILEAAESCPEGSSPGKLRDRLKDIKEFKSNKNERSILLDVLTRIGVLRPQSFDRNYPVWSDWNYFKYWKGGDGYDRKMVDYYFGRYLNSGSECLASESSSELAGKGSKPSGDGAR